MRHTWFLFFHESIVALILVKMERSRSVRRVESVTESAHKFLTLLLHVVVTVSFGHLVLTVINPDTCRGNFGCLEKLNSN